MMNIAGEYVNAGTTEIYRYGKKAQDKIKKYLEPNENGFYSIPVDGGKYYAIGTNSGKYGEFAKYKETFFSVNRGGFMWAKVETDKADMFVEFINDMLNEMIRINESRFEEGE